MIDRVENPVDKAQLLILMYLIYRIGPLAASMAVLAGAPMKVAYAIHDFMIMALAIEAEEICAAWGIGRFAFAEEPGIFNFDVFDEANWERLAELAGEPVDMQAWQAWARERGTSSADLRVPELPLLEANNWPMRRSQPGTKINGICQFWAEHEPPARHVCVEWNEGFCVEYYGTLAPCGPEVRC